MHASRRAYSAEIERVILGAKSGAGPDLSDDRFIRRDRCAPSVPIGVRHSIG